MAKRLLLADPPTGRITTNYNQGVHLTQCHYDFIGLPDIPVLSLLKLCTASNDDGKQYLRISMNFNNI